MKKQTLKILVIAFVVVMLVSATSLSYAYWDSLAYSTDIDINLGENTVLTVTVDGNTAEGKTLVPEGVLMGANDVDSVSFNYTAALSKTPENPADFNIDIIEDSIKIGGDDTYGYLVNITIDAPELISDTASITITVTLSEPSDEVEYNAIAGKAITFDISIFAE